MELTTEKTLEKTSYNNIGIRGQPNKYKFGGDYNLTSYPKD